MISHTVRSSLQDQRSAAPASASIVGPVCFSQRDRSADRGRFQHYLPFFGVCLRGIAAIAALNEKKIS